MATTSTKVRLSKGKFNNINAVADANGTIRAAAMDQRGSLQKPLEAAAGRKVTLDELVEFKSLVVETLTPHATAILMDVEYGLPALAHRAAGAGVLLAYEKSGYDTTQTHRLPDLMDHWSVRRLVEAGANAIKILLYIDPDGDESVNDIKLAWIERIGAECRALDVPFFLEPITYSEGIADEKKDFEFAKLKPHKVRKAMEIFSRPRYGIDVLKVEVPFNVKFVEGSRANTSGQVAYSEQEAIGLFSYAAEVSRLPFIYLSAGVSDEVFRESLEMANKAGVPYSGVLCGRATWQDGIAEYGKNGPDALRAWLLDRGVRNLDMLNQVLDQGAKPWWDFYGGLDSIEVVEPNI